jgi:hypothetical protein
MTTRIKHATHDSLAVRIEPTVRREDYLNHMTFRRRLRPMFTEIFGPLIGLKDEWAKQGATPEELDLSAFRYRAPMKAHIRVKTGWIGGNPEQVIEETDDYLITCDSRGRHMKLCKGFATLPLPMNYPVVNMDDWLAIKHHYLFSEERFAEGWEKDARQKIEAGYATVVSIPGGFDEPRQLMGEEMLCIAFHEQPELIHDMLSTMADTTLKVLERVCDQVIVDEVFVHEDLAGKSGPLIGPRQVTEFMKPYYRRVWDTLRERGARLFSQDSDGDINAVISAFIDAGVNVMFPMEPAAGMDIVAARHTFGEKLAFIGGIDKYVLRKSREEIEAELEYKIPPMVATGGCVLGLDHRIPNGTPLDNYRFYIRKAWEIMDREAEKLESD